MKMTFEEVVESLKQEREHQDKKWGSLEEKQQTLAGYMLVIKKELAEAEDGWMKNIEGKHSALSEIRQVAAVAIACLQQHGIEGNPH
jgi:NTP pyrophosphatase (non-canonical NTP hydrolase)